MAYTPVKLTVSPRIVDRLLYVGEVTSLGTDGDGVGMDRGLRCQHQLREQNKNRTRLTCAINRSTRCLKHQNMQRRNQTRKLRIRLENQWKWRLSHAGTGKCSSPFTSLGSSPNRSSAVRRTDRHDATVDRHGVRGQMSMRLARFKVDGGCQVLPLPDSTIQLS